MLWLMSYIEVGPYYGSQACNSSNICICCYLMRRLVIRLRFTVILGIKEIATPTQLVMHLCLPPDNGICRCYQKSLDALRR